MAQKEKIGVVLFLVATCLASLVWAEPTSFGPVTFNVPQGWKCQIEGQSMICLDEAPASKRNSALVVTFKSKSGEDNLTIYRDQLIRPRILKNGEVSTPSSPKGVRDIDIGGQKWIEGIHLGSEMPSYFTHYYATTTADTAVLISLSVEEGAHEEALKLLLPVIHSVRISGASNSTDDTNSNGIHQSQTPNESLMNNVNNADEYLNAPAKETHLIEILGNKVHRNYIILAFGALVVFGLMVYAIFME